MVCCINCKNCVTLYQDINSDMYKDNSVYECKIDGFTFGSEIANVGGCDFYVPLDCDNTEE